MPQYNEATPSAMGASAKVTDCNGQVNWNTTQQPAQSLGVYQGRTTAQARSNYVVSAFMSDDPPATSSNDDTASVPVGAATPAITVH